MQGLSPVQPKRYSSAVIREDKPAYRITDKKGFYDCYGKLHKNGAMIYWTDEPNLEMVPLNKKAKEKFKKYLAMLDEEGRKVAALNGKGYKGLSHAFQAAQEKAQRESRGVEVIGEIDATPLMSNKMNRKPEKIEEITGDEEIGEIEDIGEQERI